MQQMLLFEAFRSSWLISCFGIILYLAGMYILYRNEGQAVHQAMSLREALKEVFTVYNPNDNLQQLEGRLVHIVGPIICGEPLTAPDYNIQVQAVKLKRRVHMYQWVEETIEQNYGESVSAVETESKTYYYSQQWRDHVIDSRQFYIPYGHKNPERFPIESGIQISDAVFIGKYELNHVAKSKINNFVELTSDTRPENPDIKMHLGLYYHTNDIFNPQIGDLRILFTVAGLEGEYYTIVGKVVNSQIVPYKTSRGVNFLLVYPGEHSVHAVFQKERYVQRFSTWGGRFLGWVLIFFAVTCTSKLVNIILTNASMFTFLAPDEAHPITGNLLLSMSLALVIAAVAWFLHRPLIGAGLILAAASPYVWCWRGLFN